MWSRANLKEKAKMAFKNNYWKCVLVAFVLMIAVGGSSGGSSSANRNNGNPFGGQPSTNLNQAMEGATGSVDSLVNSIASDVQAMPAEGIAVAVVAGLVAVLVIMAIAFALQAFLLNPLQLGCRKFFAKNLNEQASLKEIGAGFEYGYLNIVKTMFLVDLYTFLWSLLFIIPGIIKRYEYRMVVYLLAQNPEMSTKEAFAKSKELMDGQKWNAFVLDLSFIGWELLGILTCGILLIFYVDPYVYQTEAALFEQLNGGVYMED